MQRPRTAESAQGKAGSSFVDAPADVVLLWLPGVADGAR